MNSIHLWALLLTCSTATIHTVARGMLFQVAKQGSPTAPAHFSAVPDTSKIECSMMCKNEAACFGFCWLQGLCHLFNTIAFTSQSWISSSAPCDIYTGKLAAKVDPVVEQLSLKLLYRFATHGLVNVVDPSQSTLQPGSIDVPVDSEGAHFVNDHRCYLVANTPGLENIVNKNNTYSLFVRAKHPLNSEPSYAQIRQCNSNSHVNDFYLFNGEIWNTAFWPAEDTRYRSRSAVIYATTSSVVSQVSAGVVFNRDHHDGFFFNGTMYPVDRHETSTVTGLQNSWFQCLHIGGLQGYASYQLQGTMSCFALSTRLLTEAEFVQLDSWCSLT